MTFKIYSSKPGSLTDNYSDRKTRVSSPAVIWMCFSHQGPFVLSMSPGFFGFFAHIGALIALEDEGLLQGVS